MCIYGHAYTSIPSRNPREPPLLIGLSLCEFLHSLEEKVLRRNTGAVYQTEASGRRSWFNNATIKHGVTGL